MKSAHDCSEGGLAVAIAESCIKGEIGFKGEFETRGRWDVQLFGEQQSRIVISVKEGDVAEVMRLCIDYQVEVLNLGKVGGQRLCVPGLLDVSVAEISDAWMVGV